MSSDNQFHKQFLRQFTEDFLEKFYGDTGYFNVKRIAAEAEESIIKRAILIKKLADDYPEIIKILLKIDKKENGNYNKIRTSLNTMTESGEIDEEELYEVTSQIEDNLFIHDLFIVTSIPSLYAYSLCEGPTPSNFKFTEKTAKLNYKFNMKLLKEPFGADDSDSDDLLLGDADEDDLFDSEDNEEEEDELLDSQLTSSESEGSSDEEEDVSEDEEDVSESEEDNETTGEESS
jgi:hypothetical protein